MKALPRRLQAIEVEFEVMECVRTLEKAMAAGAQDIAAHGVKGYWQPRLGFGVCIFRYRRPNDRLWIGFSRSDIRFKDNLVVEINPPLKGVRPAFQGVVAVDESSGDRWLLHRGGMQVVGHRIVAAESLALSMYPTAEVAFSDESRARCFVVACLDTEPKVMQRQVSTFVRECQRIRDKITFGSKAAEEEMNVEDAESEETGEGNPETEGTYTTPPQNAKTVERRHATVWKVLKRELVKRGRRCSSKRVGRFGPDLRTLNKKRTLFEIKTSIYAWVIQQAVGQLIMYEYFLGAPHQKVLVIPRGLPVRLARAVAAVGIRIVQYRWRSGGPVISPLDLDKVIHPTEEPAQRS